MSSPSATNIEVGPLRDGYPTLAAWIARDPDSDSLIFRKFGCLSARNILHLQAKLVALEHEINQQDEEARQTDPEARQSSRRWETLMKNGNDANRQERKRIKNLDELQQLLREYYEHLVLQSQIAGMRKPNDRTLSAFREFLNGSAFQYKNRKPVPPLISGRAKAFLNDENDLLTLAKSTEDDLSQLPQNHWFFKKRKTDDPLDHTVIYKNSHTVRTVAGRAMILAAFLLIGAILNLYLVPDPKAKLGLVAMYTMLFASSVALCTDASRAEVFAATAAYAAVLAVFVSGELGGDKREQCLIQLEGGIWKTIRCPS